MSTLGLLKSWKAHAFVDKKERYEKIAERSLQDLSQFMENRYETKKV